VKTQGDRGVAARALRHVGINAISPIVDVTNYVMIEMGQPMHATTSSVFRGASP